MGGFSNGVYSRFFNWVNDANASINITASRCDTEDNGFATGLSTCLLKDGTQTVTANIPFAGFKLTGLGNATLATDAVNMQTVQSGAYMYATASGTNTVLLTVTPAISAYSVGQEFRYIAPATNTGALQYNINGIGLLNGLKKTSSGLTACTGGETVINQEYAIFYDGTQLQVTATASTPVLNPFSDAAALVKNSADATKLAIFSAASISTGTTRTYTFQDSNYTVIGRDTTDTLTNKTFDTAGTGNSFKIAGTSVTSLSGNTSKVATTSGTLTSTHLAAFDGSGNIVDGGILPTQIVTALGVGSFVIAIPTTGGPYAAGATIAGSSLSTVGKGGSTAWVAGSDTLTGTWQALMASNTSFGGLWQRIS